MLQQASALTGELVFKVEGVLDSPSAEALRTRIDAVRPGTSVVLDFTHTEVIEDLALAILLHDIGAALCRVHARGLSRHQERLLRYLGFAAATN
jgi:anti-anti-sigma regulatory factor